MKRYKLFFLFLLTAALLLSRASVSVFAAAGTPAVLTAAASGSDAGLNAANEDTKILQETYSDIEIISSAADDIASPSPEMSVKGIIEFMVLWSVIYVVIRYIRYRQSKKKVF